MIDQGLWHGVARADLLATDASLVARAGRRARCHPGARAEEPLIADDRPSPDARRATLLLHGDLGRLAGAATATVPAAPPRSVKDAIESVGVPHTEIGLLRVDGTSVGLDERVGPGVVVDVHPDPVRPLPSDGVRLRPPPPSPLRFVADVHLGTLARRLRTLGLDTWWRNDADDRTLARVAVDEDRVLLTRDRGLLMRRQVVHGHLPRVDDPDRQLVGLAARFDLSADARPLRRCIRCNGSLRPVAKEQVADRLPPATRREHDRFSCCDRCAQVYWPGTHLEGLRAVLRSTVGD